MEAPGVVRWREQARIILGGPVPATAEAMSNGATLGSLIESIGTEIIRVASTPAGLNVAAGNPVIDDPAELTPLDAGDLVLAVGTPADSPAAPNLIARAGRAGACAVAFHSAAGLPAGLVQASEAAGVALLSVVPAMAWSQLHTLLRGAVAAAGSSDAPDGLGGAIGDLFGLANAIAAMVGGPTTIEDPQSTVLAFSSLAEAIDDARRATILGRKVPEDWVRRLQQDGVFRRLWAEQGVLRVEYPGIRPRLATAIRAGGEILGSIWVAQDARPFDAAAEKALLEAARIAALHLIRARSSEDLERNRRGGFLRSLLEGNAVAELLAGALGVPASSFVTVLAFGLPDGATEELAQRGSRVCRLLDLYCESARRRGASAVIGSTVYLLLADDVPPPRERLQALATELLGERHSVLPPGTLVAIGPTLAGLEMATTSRADADRVLSVLPSLRPPREVASIESVRSRVILLRLAELVCGEAGLLEGPLAELARRDSEGKGHHVETLRAFLEAFGDVARAAKSIGVHPNTFRYRMRRLEEVSGLNLDDPDERLVAHLQLRIGGPLPGPRSRA